MSKQERENRIPKALAALAAVCLIAVMAFCFAGCKYTDVLTEHIEDPENGVLDENADPIYKDVPGAPEDPNRVSSTPSETDNIDQQTADNPEYDQDTPDDEQTDQRQQRDDTSHDENATEGTEPSDKEEESQGSQASEQSTSGKADPSDAESDEAAPGDEGNGGSTATGGAGGAAAVYDATGTLQDLPANVDGIAAAGQYATIVQMLAGKGGLVAADADWISTVQAEGAFTSGGDEGIGALATGWSGDGGKAGTADVQALIAAHPTVVLSDGNESVLSASEQQQLVDAGISVVTVPTLGTSSTADADIVQAVQVVGELLKNTATQYDASKAAATYVQYHDAALNAVKSANGGYSYKTVNGVSSQYIYQGTGDSGTATTELSTKLTKYTSYIDSWGMGLTSVVANRHWNDASLVLDGQTIDSSLGVGLSSERADDNFVLIDYYLQTAGVVNNAYEGAKPAKSTRYPVIPGTNNILSDCGSRSTPSALWFSVGASTWTNSSTTTVGDASYPAVLVRSDDYKGFVTRSAAEANGLYNVGKTYSVWTVPSGLAGSWADGTVESYLLAPWAYDMFQRGQSLNDADSYVSSFYSTFYRCADVNTVLKDYGSGA